MLLLEQPARVTWVDGMKTRPDRKIIPNSKSKDFETIREALRFIMEKINIAHRSTAQIHSDALTLYEADIKRMYAEIK